MIEISVEQLETTVLDIRSMNQSLTDILYQLKGQMSMLEGSWAGEVANTFRDKVHLLDSKFEMYHQIIERYAAHLEAIIEQYRLTEQNLHRNVAQFS